MSDKVNARLYTPPPVEINEVKYQRQRLGYKQELALANLGFKAIGAATEDVDDLDKISDEEFLFLLGGLIEREDLQNELLALLKSTLQDFPFSIKEMKDPDIFPLGSVTAILTSLIEDKDVEAFFGSVRKLLKLRKKLRGQRSPKKSTSSKKGTAGRTSKS